MKGQSGNFVLVFFLIFLIYFDVLEAAKFIRNKQSQTCLQYASNSTQTCSPITLINCPVDRFGEISDLIKWNIISTNPSQITENFIESFDNKLCLTTLSNSAVQTCPCNNGVTQKWKQNGDGSLMSSSNDGKCLTMVAGNLFIDTCQNNSTSSSWEIYNVAPNAVNVYVNPSFSGNATQLFTDTTYTSNNLPQSIFTSPFSIEIPTGFTFEINLGKNDSIIYDNDISQADPIKSLTSTITINLKSGVVIYEQPAYFGNSQFFAIGANESISTQTKAIMIGSVMVPKGVRSAIWQSSDFSGKNLGLFEPIANFTGVSVATSQAPVGSFDIASTLCENECGSGGFCDNNNQCTCKQGFFGAKCDQCLPGFFGPNCQVCPTSCGDPTKFTCEDGLSGTGKCKCKVGFTGGQCDQCLPGFFGANCQACNCGNGVCDTQGNCTCNAGWTNNGTNSCSVCDTGFFLNSEGDCKICSVGCKSCEATTGNCVQCIPPLVTDSDKTKCVPDPKVPSSCTDAQYFDTTTGQCLPCDSTCLTCAGPGPGNCLKCQPPTYHFKGTCVSLKSAVNDDAKCLLQQAFFVDNSQGACEACPSTCTDCSIPGFNPQSSKDNVICSTCIPGFVLDNGKCVKNCSTGKFVGSDNFTCTACNSACATCTGPLETQCTSCTNSNFFAMNGTCSSTPCPSSYVSVNTTCTKCHPDCAECSGPGIDQCTKCSSSRPSLKNGQCVEVCPMGTYIDDSGKCQLCNKECSSCVGPNADQCLGCSNESNVLIGGSCSGTCPKDTVLIKSERLCHSETNNTLVPVTVSDNNSTQKSSGLEWWMILIIVLSILIFFVLMGLFIRYLAIKRRKKRTDEFKDALDDHQVVKQMRDLYEIAPRLAKNNKKKGKNVMLKQPEKQYLSNPKGIEIDADGYVIDYNGGTKSQIFNAPPSYDQKEGELFWQKHNDHNHEKKNSLWGENWL